MNLNKNEMEVILISYAESVSLKKGEKIPLNLATDFLSRFFYYDETQGFLYLKNNPNLTNPITVQEPEITWTLNAVFFFGFKECI